MTLLRNRDTFSASSAEVREAKVKGNEFVEPRTPTSLNSVIMLSKTPPESISPAGLCGSREVGLESVGGSVMVCETGCLRRRSARVAKNLDKHIYFRNTEVASGKMNDFEFEVGGKSLNGEFGVNSLKNEVLDLERDTEEFRKVPDSSITSLSFENVGNGVDDLVTLTDKVDDGCSVKLGLDDFGSSKLNTAINMSRKRKFYSEIKLLGLESAGKNDVEKRFLTLRSGKNIAKKEQLTMRSSEGNQLQRIERTKENGDHMDTTSSNSSEEEDENDGCMKQKFTRKQKGKGKAGCETFVTRGSKSMNLDICYGIGSSVSSLSSETVYSPEFADLNDVILDNGAIRNGTLMKTVRRFSKAEKGKMKLEEKDSVNDSIIMTGLSLKNLDGSRILDPVNAIEKVASQDAISANQTDATNVNDERSAYMERFRSIAKRTASRFAHFSMQNELDDHLPDVNGRPSTHPEADSGMDDWPGPFSTAMKIIQDRKRHKVGERDVSIDKSEVSELTWIPRNSEKFKCKKEWAPALLDLCLPILAKNADAIISLECVPDVLRHRISWYLCDHRQMDDHFLKLLVHGTPTEICIKDCSWISEELFSQIFESCDTSNLTVLQLDLCGLCLPDYVLSATFARVPNSLPALSSISLKGAYRLSDAGLSVLASSAPCLKSIDIGQCPSITSDGIRCLLNSLKLFLRELHVDYCDGIDVMLIIPELLELENLEVLSVAGVQTVCDDFVSQVLSIHGCNMKNLVLADCVELTDYCLKVIGETCPGLCSLNLKNLRNLTNVSIGHLANGCQEIQKLKLCRNAFSDEAIAAYVDLRGDILRDLSLNNIIKVSNNTALSVAKNCRNLMNLDLSWCRNLSNEALGLIVDSCSSLEVLKLFGCTQITDVFLNGHSNPHVKFIGLKMTPICKHM